jgi:hypothetical protein
LGVFVRYSLKALVFGSRRPKVLAIWPVYQMAPSAAASGSCGNDRGVGTVHSSNETLTFVGATVPVWWPRQEHGLDRRPEPKCRVAQQSPQAEVISSTLWDLATMSKTRFSLHLLSAGPGDLDGEEQLCTRAMVLIDI